MHKNLCATFCGKPVESVENTRKPRLPRANLFKAGNAYALPSLERLQFYYKPQNKVDKNKRRTKIKIARGRAGLGPSQDKAPKPGGKERKDIEK